MFSQGMQVCVKVFERCSMNRLSNFTGRPRGGRQEQETRERPPENRNPNPDERRNSHPNPSPEEQERNMDWEGGGSHPRNEDR